MVCHSGQSKFFIPISLRRSCKTDGVEMETRKHRTCSQYYRRFLIEFTGKYTCQDPETKNSSSVELGVSPEFVSSKKVKVLVQSADEEIQLSCRVKSYVYPKPKVTWYQQTKSKTIEIFRGDVMIVNQTSSSDFSRYYCEAQNHHSGPIERKTFFVKTYKPITCTVYPSNITVESNEETINVTVKISSNNPLPDIQLEPSWGMVEAINNSIYKVSGLINTTGEHKILHVTQKIGLLNNSIVTKASCFVFVTTTEPHPDAVCLLIKQKLNSSCLLQRLNRSAVELSENLRQRLHVFLGCFWSIKVYYIFSRGRKNCTFVNIGLTVSFLLEQSKHCRQYPSPNNIIKTIRKWTRGQMDLALVVKPSITNTRVYCTKMEAIQVNLPQNCSYPHVYIPCSRSTRITRICSACRLKNSRCWQIDPPQTSELMHLNGMCNSKYI
ncbi:uncharacterized protein LOC134176891 isoform X2 [Corticium candelabrum]|uniref:uncharacterized protein LOC134176891 isoform X2 n=1 Tax=Corticium candelabrum TaxID=121492 RepID=UPI002E2729BC|nr:uncharacterized protein LOC134176891 isoform X2 [Corticium candelabrum]